MTLRKYKGLYKHFQNFHDFETRKQLFSQSIQEDNEEVCDEWFTD